MFFCQNTSIDSLVKLHMDQACHTLMTWEMMSGTHFGPKSVRGRNNKCNRTGAGSCAQSFDEV